MKNKLVFTMDCENWSDSENIKPYVSSKKILHSSFHVMDKVLKFLDNRNIKGTFFFLGTLAEKNKSLVQEIHISGHEIANHGWDHTLLENLTQKETDNDIKKSTNVIESIIGDKVFGYRSPCFSQNIFVRNILEDEGYLYTSMGIRSSFHDRYENNDIKESGIPDFGLPVTKIGNFHVPCTGGGWFRLFPIGLQNRLLRKSKQNPKIFYCHPWDFDTLQPVLSEVPILVRLRHSLNVDKAFKRLNDLDFSLKPLKNFV